ncbi:MAG TPA: hypothetical protein VM717_07275 [Chthoniobacterales bacterium]|jgi:hypothetical protein|nr:hypothetical protein [Chthoniobacterales bacterium]
MKPSSDDYRRPESFRKEKRRAFPITDCNYQEFSPHRYYGGFGGNPAASFRNISREYFRYEAPRHFLAEAAFFLAFAAILALTFISGAIVIIHFLNLPEA